MVKDTVGKAEEKNTSRITRTLQNDLVPAQPQSKLLILSIDLATLGLALGNPVGQFFRNATVPNDLHHPMLLSEDQLPPHVKSHMDQL